MIIRDILKDTNYKLTQFKIEYIKELEESIFFKKIRKKQVAFINCLIRKKDIELTPEEIIRQLYIKKLIEEYSYPIERISVEESLYLGSSNKFVYIVIKYKNNKNDIFIFIEIKKSKDAKEQLTSYFNSIEDTKNAIWTNGGQTICYNVKDNNNFKFTSDIPKATKFLIVIDFFKKASKHEFLLYIITVSVLIVAGFIGLIKEIEKETLKYIITVLLFIAVSSDLVNFSSKYKAKTFGILLLFLFSILIYFVNIQAEYMAYDMITITTGEKADYFPIVIDFFQAIYFPIALIIIISKNYIYLLPIIVLVVLFPFLVISSDKWKNKIIHLSSFLISIIVLFALVFTSNIGKLYESYFGENYIPKKIIEYSYHKNTTCKDKDGKNIDTYINFLYKDTISVTNVKDLNYSNFASKNDINITFSTQKCIR